MHGHQTTGTGSVKSQTWAAEIIKPGQPIAEHTGSRTGGEIIQLDFGITAHHIVVLAREAPDIYSGLRANCLGEWYSRCSGQIEDA